jgi:hypothetical protein
VQGERRKTLEDEPSLRQIVERLDEPALQLVRSRALRNGLGVLASGQSLNAA